MRAALHGAGSSESSHDNTGLRAIPATLSLAVRCGLRHLAGVVL
eukprot:CAMPEP_0115867654 /NCGR_PEP_ID=MMETSP0287-20121206/20878_1 /TAXON_ID=412157 /ORGANISM="Chrysochromulina rotalis, Strain UIO044" /LENGTH=43 /DNA_ID= /DNA_START= /DNA_END= /DNA_ORIENTATION=